MTKKIRILSIIALIQLVLMTIIWNSQTKLKAFTNRSTLLNFNLPEINHLVIKGGNSGKIELSKIDDKWQTINGFPADQNKVDSFISKLASLKYNLAIATSRSALERFKVADDSFERYIELKDEDTVLEKLFIGTGAGARQSHVRSGDQNAVYRASIASYEVPLSLDDWYDKDLLKINKTNVSALDVNEVRLYKEKGADKENPISVWKTKAEIVDKKLNQKAIDESLDVLSSLRFEKVLGKKVQADFKLEKPELKLEIEYNNSKLNYLFAKIDKSEKYVLKVSSREEYFQIEPNTAKKIVDTFNKDNWLSNKTDSIELNNTSNKK